MAVVYDIALCFNLKKKHFFCSLFYSLKKRTFILYCLRGSTHSHSCHTAALNVNLNQFNVIYKSRISNESNNFLLKVFSIGSRISIYRHFHFLALRVYLATITSRQLVVGGSNVKCFCA